MSKCIGKHTIIYLDLPFVCKICAFSPEKPTKRQKNLHTWKIQVYIYIPYMYHLSPPTGSPGFSQPHPRSHCELNLEFLDGGPDKSRKGARGSSIVVTKIHRWNLKINTNMKKENLSFSSSKTSIFRGSKCEFSAFFGGVVVNVKCIEPSKTPCRNPGIQWCCQTWTQWFGVSKDLSIWIRFMYVCLVTSWWFQPI